MITNCGKTCNGKIEGMRKEKGAFCRSNKEVVLQEVMKLRSEGWIEDSRALGSG